MLGQNKRVKLKLYKMAIFCPPSWPDYRRSCRAGERAQKALAFSLQPSALSLRFVALAIPASDVLPNSHLHLPFPMKNCS